VTKTARQAVGWLLAVIALAGAGSGAPAAGEEIVTRGEELEALGLLAAPAGVPAPDFALRDPGGRLVRLSDLRGVPVLVTFWATWCTPCELEMPGLERLRRAVSRLRVVGVNVNETAERALGFARARGLGFPVLLDVDGAVTARYRVESLPFTVIVDHRGHARAVAEGARSWDAPAMVALLRRLARESY
jgi:peroxiredoxin